MPESPRSGAPPTASTLILACGALAREFLHLVALNGWSSVSVECLPAALHNTPDRIPEAVEARLERASQAYDRIFVGYADCGTGGRLDHVLERYGVERLPGAHCYEFYATAPVFAGLQEAELGTFYLTDYLTRHFDRLVIEGLGIARHPELEPVYFGHYRRLVYLSQHQDPALLRCAQAAADRLGLAFEHRHVGYGQMGGTVEVFIDSGAG
jgi:hypothetical protein